MNTLAKYRPLMDVFLSTDVQKFPLRMKDNDLLVTELYRDPTEDAITALSVYLTPKTSMSACFDFVLH